MTARSGYKLSTSRRASPMSVDAVQVICKRAGEAAGLKYRVHPHMLRHSLARRMLERGAQLPEVQRVLGHSRLSTTGIYLTPSEEDVRLAIGRAGV